MTDTVDIGREQALFLRCIEHPASEWQRVLDEACDDPALRARVLRLLARHHDSSDHESGFLKLDSGDPERVGPYRILQRLGEGGMGIVYAAEQREPIRRRVAIKVLRAGFNSREILTRFEAERQALALMNHASIAHIIEAGTTADHRPYIVMEFVAGESITRYCERRDLPLTRRLKLFAEVCDAVQHAHQKGVIHRDLKPTNILVAEENGRPLPKVIDFGIAKAMSQRLTDNTLETRVGSLLGTPDYMSPEQAELSPLDVDTRADVYALGAVLYELLTGVPPLSLSGSGMTFPELQRAIHEQQPAPPSRRVAGVLQRHVKGELDWIVMKALEKQRTHRYASAAEFARDIRAHLAHDIVIAGPPSRWRPVGKFLRHYWLATTSVFAVTLLLAVSQALLLQKNRDLVVERERANTAAHNAEEVTAVLAEIFRAVDPDERDARDLSVVTLLRHGRDRVLNDVEMSLPVRAQLLDVIGGAFFHLGYHDEAAEMLRESLQAADASGDQKLVADTLHTRARLVAALQEGGEVEAARALLDEALVVVKELGLWDTAGGVSIRNALALHHLFLRESEQAAAILEPVLAAYRALHGPHHERVLSTMFNLAHAYRDIGRVEESRRIAEQLIVTATERYGAEHSLIGDARLHLANILRDEGDIAGARDNYRQAAALFARLSGPYSRQALNARMGLALVHRGEVEGLSMMQELHRDSVATFGEDALLTLMIAANLADFLKHANQLSEAEQLARKANASFRQILGAQHPYTQETSYLLAVLHAGLGNHTSSAAMLRQLADDSDYRKNFDTDPEFAAVRDLPVYAEFRAQASDGPRNGELPAGASE